MYFNKLKQSHSNIEHLKHTHTLSNMKQLLYDWRRWMIFELIWRVIEIKINMRGMYDKHECRACGEKSENQELIIKCDIIN